MLSVWQQPGPACKLSPGLLKRLRQQQDHGFCCLLPMQLQVLGNADLRKRYDAHGTEVRLRAVAGRLKTVQDS